MVRLGHDLYAREARALYRLFFARDPGIGPDHRRLGSIHHILKHEMLPAALECSRLLDTERGRAPVRLSPGVGRLVAELAGELYTSYDGTLYPCCVQMAAAKWRGKLDRLMQR